MNAKPTWILGVCLATLAFAGCDDDTGSVADTSDVSDDVSDDATADVDPTDTTDDRPIVDIEPWVPSCDAPPELATRTYDATIRWASYGVPYITADDLPNVVFGQSYAMTRDHICTLADQYLATRSERAQTFGAGTNNSHVISDLSWKSLGLREHAQCQLATMSEQSREFVRAVAAGYNKYLAETGVDAIPEPCRGAEWVKPIDELDVAAYYLAVVMRGSGDVFRNIVATSEPPSTTDTTEGSLSALSQSDEAMEQAARELSRQVNTAAMGHLGSNGWGIGSERTESGNGMLLSNPHFPWEGSLRFYESHLTVPGELNVHGVSLVGTPSVLIGFNEHLGWTHTVSTSNRFSMYVLSLDPSDPTVYQYEDERRRMATHDVTVMVKGDDGTLSPVDKTVYYSHYGPIISVAPVTWNNGYALTYRDANLNNTRMFDHWLAKDKATTLEEFRASYDDSGIPWVNTMYADKLGNAFYIDGTQVPHLSDDVIDWWRTAIVEGGRLAETMATLVWGGFGAFCFDGSIASHEWVVEDDAFEPGLVPSRLAPQLANTSYVMNANDSYWFSNAETPIEGFSPLYGSERTQLTPRTRLNARQLSLDDPASGADGKFSLDELKAMRTNGRNFLSEEFLDDVVGRCLGVDSVTIDDASVPIAAACDVLDLWDGTQRLELAGPPLWREVLSGLRAQEALAFDGEFDADDAIATPAGLLQAPDEGVDPVLVALGMATNHLAEAGFPVDVTFGDTQYTLKGDERIPVPGGFDSEGSFNIARYGLDRSTVLPNRLVRGDVVNSDSGLTSDGYLVNYGNSIVMAVEFTPDGPDAFGILTYSQSSDPDSPHFADQTQLYSTDGWRQIAFTEEELAADPNLTTQVISSE